MGYTSHGIDVPVTSDGFGTGMTVDFNISADKLTKKGVGYTSDGVDVNATNITAGPVKLGVGGHQYYQGCVSAPR